jgi:cell wall-associated NlpC family hydrolase
MTRQDIVYVARLWIGVRYKHQGRSLAGIDCAGLIIKVAHHFGVSDHDETTYPRRPNAASMIASLESHAKKVKREPLPGDIMLLSFEGFTQHLAIRSDRGMIHSYALARKVVEHPIDDVWRSRLVMVYEYPGVTD